MKSNKIKCDCNLKNQILVNDIASKRLANDDENKISTLFKIIGDKTRLNILWALKESKLCVCDLCGVVNMTKSAVSHQLKILREIEAVKFVRQGKHCYYSLNDNCIEQIINIAFKHLHHKEI